MKMPNGERESFRASVESPTQNAENPEAAFLPTDVKESFLQLSHELQDRIFPRMSGKSAEVPVGRGRNREQSLQEALTGLDQKSRERFAIDEIQDLASVTGLCSALRFCPSGTLSSEVERFMETVWGNRGKDAEFLEIFNRERYEKLFAERAELEKVVAEKEAAVKEAEQSIEVTKKQKRLTVLKQEKLAPLQVAYEKALEELKQFDGYNNNTRFDRAGNRCGLDILRDKERAVTRSAQVVTEYLEPDEFATIISEQLDKIFSSEAALAKSPDGTITVGNRKIKMTSDAVERARFTYDLLQRTVSNWYERHHKEKSFHERREVIPSEKQQKLLTHFAALFGSYKRAKQERRASDEQVLGEVRQMQVTLGLLKRLDKTL